MKFGKYIGNKCLELTLIYALKGINLLSMEAQNQLRFKNLGILEILSNLVFQLLPCLNISNRNYDILLLMFSTFNNFLHEPTSMVILCEKGLLGHINTAFSMLLNEMWDIHLETKYKLENLIINSINNPTDNLLKCNNIFPVTPSKACESSLNNSVKSATRSGCTYSSTTSEVYVSKKIKKTRGKKINHDNDNKVPLNNNDPFQSAYNTLSDETNDPIINYYSGEEEYFVEKLGNSHEYFYNSPVISHNYSTSLNVDGTNKPKTLLTTKEKNNTANRPMDDQVMESPGCEKLAKPRNEIDEAFVSPTSSGTDCNCDAVKHDISASNNALLEVLYSLLAQIFRMYHQNPMAIVKQSTEIFDTMLELLVYSREPDHRLIRILNRLGKNEKFLVTLLGVGFPLKLHQMLAAYTIRYSPYKKSDDIRYVTKSPTFCSWRDNPYTKENKFYGGNLNKRLKMDLHLGKLQTSVTHFALKNSDPIFSVQCGLCFLKGHFLLKVLATFIDNFRRCGPSHIRVLLTTLPTLWGLQKIASTITAQYHEHKHIHPFSNWEVSEWKALKIEHIGNDISPFLYKYENSSALERIKLLISIICSSILLIKPHLLRKFNQRCQISHHLRDVISFFDQPLLDSVDVKSISTIAMMLNLTYFFFRVHVQGEDHGYYNGKYTFEGHAREAFYTVKHLFESDASLSQAFGIKASSSFKAFPSHNKGENTSEKLEDFIYFRAEDVDDIDTGKAPDNVDKISNSLREIVVSKHISHDNNKDGDDKKFNFNQSGVGVKFNYARIRAISPVLKIMLDRSETRFINKLTDPNHMVVIKDTRHEELALLNSYVNHPLCDLPFIDFVNDSCQSPSIIKWPDLSIMLGMIDAHLGVYKLIHQYMIDGLKTCFMGSILGLYASYLIKYYMSDYNSKNNGSNNDNNFTTKHLNFTKSFQKTQWPSPLVLYGEIYKFYQSSHYTNATTYLVNFMRDSVPYFMIKRIANPALPCQNFIRPEILNFLNKSENITLWQAFIDEASQYDMVHRQDLLKPLICDILVAYIQHRCLIIDDNIMRF